MKFATAKCYVTSQAKISMGIGFCIGLLLALATGASMAYKNTICYFLHTIGFQIAQTKTQTPLCTLMLECEWQVNLKRS